MMSSLRAMLATGSSLTARQARFAIACLLVFGGACVVFGGIGNAEPKPWSEPTLSTGVTAMCATSALLSCVLVFLRGARWTIVSVACSMSCLIAATSKTLGDHDRGPIETIAIGFVIVIVGSILVLDDR